MESRLPKPLGLRKPASLTKNLLPGTTSGLFSGMPLTSNLSNITSTNTLKRARALSPDGLRVNPGRAKLRRSRSACDIRTLSQPLKRADLTLAPIPAKSGMRVNATNRPPRFAAASTTTTTTSTLAKKPNMAIKTTTVNKNATTTTTGVKKTTATTTKTTTTTTASVGAAKTNVAGKTMAKRIPPYDYKARFLDLQEKHKSLKEKYENISEQMGNLENMPEQLEECQMKLISEQEQLKHVESENKSLHTLVDSQNTKISSLSSNLNTALGDLKQLKAAHEQLTKEHTIITKETANLREELAVYKEKTRHLEEELILCQDQLFVSNMERKELHNTVMDLRGNIRVFCRVRPPLEEEMNRALCGWNYLDETTLELQSFELAATSNKNKANSHTFNFDQVFHPNCTQEDIFEMVSPLIQSALDGYNICIFAYGQTGSGKTYTMDGTQNSLGVIPRTVDLLFNAVKNYKRLGWEYEIKATFLEIYNEVLYDLLSNEHKDMEIRMVKNSRNDIYVSNITEVTVENAENLRELMQIAKMNRATAATAGNERSSRSHAVTRIELIGRHEKKQESVVGTINLVDLAGSESPKTSLRMNETKNINRSLSELTNVILALLQRQDHIPYRNSKLTHLLMPSLGGNSKTLMFINVAPFQDCFGESVKSLRFAASVNSCKVSKAKRNRFLNTAQQLNNSTA